VNQELQATRVERSIFRSPSSRRGGHVVEMLSVQVAGPHPDLFLEDAARCALIQDLIG
jgi:hypothetical protein